MKTTEGCQQKVKHAELRKGDGYQTADGRRVVVPEQAAVIVSIYERFAAGAPRNADRKGLWRIASEIAEIRAADEIILEMARAFPQAQRERIAQIRRTLTAKIMALDPQAKGRSSRSRPSQGEW